MSRTHPTRRPVWARPAVVLLLVGVVTAGCPGGTDKAGSDKASTDKAGGAPAPSTARWTALNGACPTLNSDIAKSLQATGAGRPTESAAPLPGVHGAHCAWADGPKRPSVNVGVSIYQDGFSPTNTAEGNAKNLYADLRAEAGKADPATSTTSDEPADTGEAFLQVNTATDVVSLTTRNGNAVLSVRLFAEETFTEDATKERDSLTQRYRSAVRALTADVVDDLR